jgi:alanyl-tRNA synthetase
MTVRLYYHDAYCTEFDAEVLHSIPGEKGGVGIFLDRTCFCPTSGRLPYDTGLLASQPVVDVVEVEGNIVHWAAGQLSGPSAHGHVDGIMPDESA